MTEQVEAPSAIDTEREIVEHIRRANETRSRAQRDVVRCAAELAAAQRSGVEAIQDQIRGVKNASRRVSAADKTMQLAERRQAEAARRRDVALNLANELEARLTQVREACLPELVEAMQPLVEQYQEVQHELEPLLRKLSGIHEAIHRRCRELEPGCRAKVEEIDSERGQLRSASKVEAEAKPPQNPLPAAVINMVINGSPLPLVLRPDYEPDRPASAYTIAPVDDAGFDPIFPGDPRHQKSAGPSRADIAAANAASVARQGSL